MTNDPVSVESVLPAATRDIIGKSIAKDFESKLKLPKGMDKYLVSRAIDRVILNRASVPFLQHHMGLLQSEVVYIEAVVKEYREWEDVAKETKS